MSVWLVANAGGPTGGAGKRTLRSSRAAAARWLPRGAGPPPCRRASSATPAPRAAPRRRGAPLPGPLLQASGAGYLRRRLLGGHHAL
jgi:hypothetical protein